MKRTFLLIVVTFVSINSPSFAVSYSFQGFSDISTDYIFRGMSPDGELLIGSLSGSYLWTYNGGLSQLSENNFEGIGTTATYSAETISAGASSMIGRNISTNTPVCWTPKNGSENLYELMGIEKPLSMQAESISLNGVIAGRIANKNELDQWYYQAFSYNCQTSNTTILGTSFNSTGAYGVSKDGTIVTGTYEQKPFWWTQEQGIQFLQHPEIPFLLIQEDRVSEVFDVSDDGQVLVGWSGSPFESIATIWNLNGSSIILSDVENSGIATSVSSDGKIVIGHEYLHEAPNHRIAFIWDELNGKRFLNDVLTSGGVDLGGWHLSEALAISSDGYTIMGTGINPKGEQEYWIAIVPEPTTLLLLGFGSLFLRLKRNR